MQGMEESNDQYELIIVPFVLGPAQTNVYLVGDMTSGEAVVIDPAWDGEVIAREAENQKLRIVAVWLTHAHFDHFGGVAGVIAGLSHPVPVALHPDDLPLWKAHGGAGVFGFGDFDPGPEPSIALEHGMRLRLGSHVFEVRHTPGHTQGHVLFLAREAGLAFCGDLIFQGSVGRTDLPGGDWETLLRSIKQEVLTLPDETQLLSGHGPLTTVEREKRTNPFLTGDYGFYAIDSPP
jgi:glyoxylase-like metal-dependent hydrolase (beta-lactamase superfamily II)